MLEFIGAVGVGVGVGVGLVKTPQDLNTKSTQQDIASDP